MRYGVKGSIVMGYGVKGSIVMGYGIPGERKESSGKGRRKCRRG